MKKNFFSPAVAFILGFLTLGIGNNVNIYMISDRLSFDGEGRTLYPMQEMVLNLISFGFYGIFWTYKVSKAVNVALLAENNKSFVAIMTVLSATPLRFIGMAIITNKILLSERR